MNVVNIQPDWADGEAMAVMKGIMDQYTSVMTKKYITDAVTQIAHALRKAEHFGYCKGLIVAEKVALKHRPAPIGEECPGCEVLSEIRKIRPLK